MPICNICEKSLASKYSLDRHMEKFHSDERDEDSDGDSESEEDEPMDMADEVEVIGDILNEVVNELQDEEGAETVEVSSIDDMLKKDNYTEIMEGFKEKVVLFIL